MSDLKKGDVIHLGPSHPWGGMLAFVEEVTSWGVKANILVPVERTPAGPKIGLMPVRAAAADFRRVGPPQYFVAVAFQ